MNLLIDDHLLLRVLLGDEPVDLRPAGAELATTGLWYHRLCRALSDEAVVGSMSRRLGDVDSGVAAAVIGSITDLPESVQLISLRTLGWPMAQLLHGDLQVGGVHLNLLSLEALAAAIRLDAHIHLAELDDNQPLRAGAAHLGVQVHTVPG